jgi:hypothetical protein
MRQKSLKGHQLRAENAPKVAKIRQKLKKQKTDHLTAKVSLWMWDL